MIEMFVVFGILLARRENQLSLLYLSTVSESWFRIMVYLRMHEVLLYLLCLAMSIVCCFR
jgi:hypothetical protein